jgi:hypothetical protein
LTLQQGLLTLPDQSNTGPGFLKELMIHLQMLLEQAGESYLPNLFNSGNYLNVIAKRATCHACFMFKKCLEKLSSSSAEIVNAITPDTDEQYRIWANNLLRQCQGIMDEVTYLTPWMSHPGSTELWINFRHFMPFQHYATLSTLWMNLLRTAICFPTEEISEKPDIDDELINACSEMPLTAQRKD